MSEKLREWLAQELSRRGWSHRELARQVGLSQSFVSNILAGRQPPSANFCNRVAVALDTPSVHILSLAGILPDNPDTTSVYGPVTQEIINLVERLPLEKRKEALRYIQYLNQSDSASEI